MYEIWCGVSENMNYDDDVPYKGHVTLKSEAFLCYEPLTFLVLAPTIKIGSILSSPLLLVT